MTMRDGGKHAPYAAQTDDELMQAPTISRIGPLRGQVVPISHGSGGIGRAIWHLSRRLHVVINKAGGQASGEFWPLGKPAHFRMED